MNQHTELEILYQDSESVVINEPERLLAIPEREPEKQD